MSIVNTELSDEKMNEYYSGLAKMHNNHLTGRYRHAIYFIVDGETCFASMDEIWLVFIQIMQKQLNG